MQIKLLTEALSVSGQIETIDIVDIAGAGFKSIVCNRPDGEDADQPAVAEIDAAANAAGLATAYLPIVSGKAIGDEALAFGALVDKLPKPVLAYCRTGTRSTTLWTLSESARGRSAADILSITTAAGYDMSAVLRPSSN